MIKMTGLSSQKEIIGKTDYEMPWFKNAQFISNTDNKTIQINSSYITQEQDLITETSGNTFLSIKTPWKNIAGTSIGVIGILINITQQDFIQLDIKLIEQLIANNIQVALEELKHDIRSPLSSIIALSEIIKSNSKELEITELAEMLFDASLSLDQLIISLSNVQREKSLNLKDTFFDIKIVIEDVLKLALPMARNKNIDLNYTLESNSPLFIFSNRNLIHRILMELINNAIKYTSIGSVTLEIHPATEDTGERYIIIKVIDTGLGIPPGILDRFTDANDYPIHSALKNGRGFGVGMINTAAKLLGIKIVASSSINQGSMIKLIIRSNSQNSNEDSGREAKDTMILNENISRAGN
jgi:signal transduction histidine kinase